jgi:hypothetical protein
MFDLTHDWIAPVAQHEFKNGLKLLESEYRPGQPMLKKPYIYQPDTLSIELGEERHIQLIDVSLTPFQARCVSNANQFRSSMAKTSILSIYPSLMAAHKFEQPFHEGL